MGNGRTTLVEMDATQTLQLLNDVADAIGTALKGIEDWGPSGLRDTQYSADLVVDQVALEILRAAGVGILPRKVAQRILTGASSSLLIRSMARRMRVGEYRITPRRCVPLTRLVHWWLLSSIRQLERAGGPRGVKVLSEMALHCRANR